MSANSYGHGKRSDPMRLPSLIQRLRENFASQGVTAYLVGGTVRDLLLGRETGDIDVAVAADASSVGHGLASSLAGRLVPLDEVRGIWRVVIPDGEGVWSVDVNSIDGEILEDLGRRDFTIDAMAASFADVGVESLGTKVIDPFGGCEDLTAGVIRSVRPSVFRDDPARLLRAPRLAAQLQMEIVEDTSEQIQRDAHLVTTIANERVRDELLKLLAEPCATDSMRRMDSLGLLCRIIPELEEARHVSQPKEHHWDVFNHLLETVGKVETILRPGQGPGAFVPETHPIFESINPHFAEEVSDGHTRMTMLKLAGLLHDVAKPATKTVEDDGRIRFLGHHAEGAVASARILRRLRVSGRGVELVRLMVHHHLRPSQMAHGDELPTRKAIYRYYRDTGDAAIDTLFLNMADYLAARGPQLGSGEWSAHCRVIESILNESLEGEAHEPLPKLITGHDIMGTFAVGPGPGVGRLLDLAREAQASGEITTREEALELINANMKSGGTGA